jgi:hypothetical protein
MYKVKLSPEEALETIKLRMKYDSSKTLTENVDIVKEQKSEDEIIANQIWNGAYNGGFGTNETKIVSGVQKIKDANQFASVDALLKKLSGLDIAQTINDELGSDNAPTAMKIANHLIKLGLKVDTGITNKTVGMAATSQDNFNGNFSISKPAAAPPTPAPTPTPAPVETDTKTKTDTTTKTTTTLPTELKDVKDFQDWLDKNHPGWHDKYNTLGGIVNKGYGRFGPRTTKAWATYKDEYLKKTPTPTPTGNPDLEVDDKDASLDQPF